MDEEPEIVLYDSDKAAQPAKMKIVWTDGEGQQESEWIEGWTAIYRNPATSFDHGKRFFYNGEAAARSAGSTHTTCPNCGSPRQYVCDPCFDARELEQWKKMPPTEWRARAVVTDGEHYWENPVDLIEWCLDHGIRPSSVLPVLARRGYPREEYDEFLDCNREYLPDDLEPPPELAEHHERHQAVIADMWPDVFFPGEYRLSDAEVQALDGEYDKARREDQRRLAETDLDR